MGIEDEESSTPTLTTPDRTRVSGQIDSSDWRPRGVFSIQMVPGSGAGMSASTPSYTKAEILRQDTREASSQSLVEHQIASLGDN